MIQYDDFKKIEMKIGTILSAEKVENADKLFKLSVDFGMKQVEKKAEPKEGESAAPSDGAAPAPAPVFESVPDIRQIVSGIAEYFADPASLVGKQAAFVTNLEPRMIRGLESQGMILAAKDADGLSLMTPHAPRKAGTNLS